MVDAKSKTPEQLKAHENLKAALIEKQLRVLRRPDVERITGLSRSTLYSMIAEGEFPKPIKLGKRAVGWREADIAAWLYSRTAEAV